MTDESRIHLLGQGRRPLGRDGDFMTRKDVQELMVDIVGSFAHSFRTLEDSHAELQTAHAELQGRHNALVAALGLTYHAPEGQHGKPGDLSQNGQEAVPQSGSGGPSPEAPQTPPE